MHVHKFSGTSLGKYEPKFIFHLAVLKKYIKKGWSLLYMPVKFLENPSLDIKVIISILLRWELTQVDLVQAVYVDIIVN